MQSHFFQIMRHIVKQLLLPVNTEQEVSIFLNGLRWRFSGRDHSHVANLNLFTALHKSEKLRRHWGKEIATDFDKGEQACLKFKIDVSDATCIKECQQIFDKYDGNKTGKLNVQQCKDFMKDMCIKFMPE